VTAPVSRAEYWRRKIRRLGYIPAGSFYPPPDDVAISFPEEVSDEHQSSRQSRRHRMARTIYPAGNAPRERD
jgi:hypothetical protein